jgi:hypothetical protein
MTDGQHGAGITRWSRKSSAFLALFSPRGFYKVAIVEADRRQIFWYSCRVEVANGHRLESEEPLDGAGHRGWGARYNARSN